MPERGGNTESGGADVCLYKPIPEVSCLFKSTRDSKGTIEGEMPTKWLSSECFKAKSLDPRQLYLRHYFPAHV